MENAATTTKQPQRRPTVAPRLAERFKTKLCRNWVTTGSCPYEQRCMFAHGDDEMRTREWNFRDGLTTETAIKEFQRNFYFLNRVPSPPSRVHQPYVYDPSACVPIVSVPAPPAASQGNLHPHRPSSLHGLGCVTPPQGCGHMVMKTTTTTTTAEVDGLCACSNCIAAQHQTVLAQQRQLQQMYSLYRQQQQQQQQQQHTHPTTRCPHGRSASSDDGDYGPVGVPWVAAPLRPHLPAEEYVHRSPVNRVDPFKFPASSSSSSSSPANIQPMFFGDCRPLPFLPSPMLSR
jgi:hypothetical protein